MTSACPRTRRHACTIETEGIYKDQGHSCRRSAGGTKKDSTREARTGSAVGCWLLGLPAVMRRRVAQGQPDQGWRCPSEAGLARPRLHRATQRARSAAEDGAEPDADVFFQRDLADHLGTVRDPGVLAQHWRFTV